jgi:hypothetical protein
MQDPRPAHEPAQQVARTSDTVPTKGDGYLRRNLLAEICDEPTELRDDGIDRASDRGISFYARDEGSAPLLGDHELRGRLRIGSDDDPRERFA